MRYFSSEFAASILGGGFGVLAGSLFVIIWIILF
jgi:hypothetical protein